MAQYIILFNKYADLSDFDGKNNKCVLVGPINLVTVTGKIFLSSVYSETVTEMVTTDNGKYRIGNILYTSFMVLSEDVPNMKKLLQIALQGTRIITFAEYGFLNHVKYSAMSTTVAILTPNSRKVEEHLKNTCMAKALGCINPTHAAILIFYKFDHMRDSYVIVAHSTPDAETGQQILESNECWFNYLEETQQLFPGGDREELMYDAFFRLDAIGNF